MALMREGHQCFDASHNIPAHFVGCFQTALGDKIPNLGKVKRRRARFRMEIAACHVLRVDLRLALFSRKRATTSSQGMGFTLPLFRSS
jgi:hypothetical protein